MGIVTPLALALLALALPIIVLYMLRLRRPAAPVSSILLWESVLADLEANAPWQRLRRNWLLILQLLALLALVFALARPFHRTAESASGNTIIVLDASASMRATDVSPSRFARARDEALTLVDRLGPEQRMAIILAGPMAEIVHPPSSDRVALRAALERARPSHGVANMTDAVALAAAAGQRLPRSQIVILSDGGFPPLDPALVSLPTRVVTIGASTDNVAITALAMRQTASGPSLFARVTNSGAAHQRGLLSFYADDRLLDAREIQLEGGQQTGITINDLPASASIIRAELDTPDALADDNHAWVISAASGTRLLLTAASPSGFLQRGLALLPGTSLFRASEPDPDPGYDWYVFDNLAPERLPGNTLLINPPAGATVAAVTGAIERPRLTRVEREHPLLAGVDLSRLNIARAAAIDPPPWAQVLVEADGAPLLLAGETAGQRVVIIAFDLRQSDLPLQVAFPVLLNNLHHWLAGDTVAGGTTLDRVTRPGDLITLHPGPDIDEVIVRYPDGREQVAPLSDGSVRLADTALLGPYRFSLRAGGHEQRATWVAVNLLSDDESSIAPVTHPTLGTAPTASAAPAEAARQEVWWPLLLLGSLLLLAEWWLFYRGTCLPALRLDWRRSS